MCCADSLSALHLCYFVGNVLYPTKKYELNLILSWLSQIMGLFTECYLTIIHFQDCILKLIFPDLIKVNYINETLFVNSNFLPNSHNKWSLFEFECQSKTFKRILKVIPSSEVPKGSILCSNDTFLMIITSFKLNPCLPYKRIKFKLVEALNEYKHQTANKLSTSVLYCPPHSTSNLFNKVLEQFIKSPKLMHIGDVVSIDLFTYSIEKMPGFIYFKVIDVEGPVSEHSNEIEHSFFVSQSTTVFGEGFCQCYLPSLEWILMDYRKLSSLTPLLPMGLEKYYTCLLKWIQPFLVSAINGLKPIFIISGVGGCGKSVIIEAVSKKLGLHYWNVDCNNIISNTLSQINANIKTTLKNAAVKSPCILHLRNYQMMSLESDGVDSVQLCESLRFQLENFTNSYPVIIIATCDNIDSLRKEFIRLSLEQMHIGLPSEKQRMLMITWLLRTHSIKLDQNTIEFLITETKSYPFARIRNLICLAEKERLICKDDLLITDHFTTVIGRMSTTERLSSSVEWADVGGVELIKKEVVASLISSRLLSTKTGSSGARRTGLLLYGPPGTGKTLLARAVASQSMRAFVPVNGPDLLNMYVGQSEANVRAVFSRAREASPCIMFFDELDSIAPNRGNKSDSGGVMDRVVSTLLSEMDNLDTSGDVFILGATNRPDLLDPALLRPGRFVSGLFKVGKMSVNIEKEYCKKFDKMLHIGPCQDEDSKLKVLKALSRKFLLEDVILEDLVKLLPDEVTGATMYSVCSSAWLSAARQLIRDGHIKSGTKVVVQMKHFQQAIDEMVK